MTGHREGKFEGANGTELFFQQWLVSESKGRLLFVHGLAEHSSRYLKTAQFFNQSGYDTVHFDLRGHGKSEGQRAFAASLEELLSDIDRFILKFAQNGKPTFLVGHSFGGQLVLNYVASPYEGIQRIKGLILSAPNIRVAIDIPAIKVRASQWLSRLIPRLPLGNELQVDHISHDPEIVRAYDQDPLVSKKITTRLGDIILRNQEIIYSVASKVRLPCLLMHGGDDRICSTEATKEFFQKMTIQDKVLKIYPGFYHELFNEIGKERVFHDMVEWIEKHI